MFGVRRASVSMLLLRALRKMEFGESVGSETTRLQVRGEMPQSRFGRLPFSVCYRNRYYYYLPLLTVVKRYQVSRGVISGFPLSYWLCLFIYLTGSEIIVDLPW